MKKKIYMFLMTVIMSVGTYAQSNKLYIEDIRISRAGETILSVYMDNVDEITAVEFNLDIPEGFTLDPLSALLSERMSNHTVTARLMGDGTYKFVVMSPDNSLIGGNAGQILTVRLSSSETVSDAISYPMAIRNAVMSTSIGENVCQEVAAGNISIKGLPDLHVISLDCSEPIAGNALTVQWKVRNDGFDETGEITWKDYVWLVPNISGGTSMTGYKLLATVDNLSALLPGESYENSVIVVLEERIYGNYDLLVTSDMYGVSQIDFSTAGGEPPVPYQPEVGGYGFLYGFAEDSYSQLVERNEYDGISDNFFYKRINIEVPPLPDIQVPHVVAVVDNSESYEGESVVPSPITSAGLASSSSFYSGKKVKVTATIVNEGEMEISNQEIQNVLYISSTPELGTGKAYRLRSNSMELTVKDGETATCEFSAYIPYDWYGDTYFIVEADVNDAVYELANTKNNVGVSTLINTLLTPGADFEPYELSIPSVIPSGGTFDITYAVRNIGAGVPYVTSWTDKVYILQDATEVENATPVAQLMRTGGYKQTSSIVSLTKEYQYTGDEYTATHTLNVGDLQSGTYYVVVVADANDDVFEYAGEENNVLVSKAITVVEPDLAVELLSVSGDKLVTGNKVAVSWKLKNVGHTDILNTTISDEIYAKTNAGSIQLGSVTNEVSIPAGGEKVLRANITIPAYSQLNGQLPVHVRTNVGYEMMETNKDNNISEALLKTFEYSILSSENVTVQGTNLTVYALDAPEKTAPGEQVNLSYYIRNTGTLPVTQQVKQEIYVSKYSTFNSSARICEVSGTLPDVTGLENGHSVKADLVVTIPEDCMGGNNYIYVIVNRDTALPEVTREDNTMAVPVYLSGHLPNLQISRIDVPESVMTSSPFKVEWVLSNSGEWESSSVVCKLFLSTDAVYDNKDIPLTSVRSSVLPEGESEILSTTIQVKDGMTGIYYIIVMADIIEESVTEDNVTSQEFASVQSPMPDLLVSELLVDGTPIGGQSITVKATVTNGGESETREDKWTMDYYLSKGYSLDVNTAIKLGSHTHVGTLGVGEKYVASVSLNLPVDLFGNYVLHAIVDATDVLYEISEDNNSVLQIINLTDPFKTPADLVVSNVVAPAVIQAGETVSIAYTIANEGAYPAKGKLRDVFYLSEDARWDEGDVMVGVATGEVDIEPGNTETRTAFGRITNIPEGEYYMIVRTNSTRTIAESDYSNNMTSQVGMTSVEFVRLQLGSSVTVHTSGLYKLPLHSGLEGKTIGLYLTHPQEVMAGLYASYGEVPSTAGYEWAASLLETEEQEVLIPDVKEGTYYILAQDNAAVSKNLNEFVLEGNEATLLQETTMTLAVREVPFGATSLDIREGGSNGWISTEINGALFDSIMDFRLVRGKEVIPAEAITFHNQTATKATFNLNDAEVGVYDLLSELPDGTQATLPEGFSVVPGTNVSLGVKLDAPQAVRITGYAPVSVTYVNGGNTDIVIKELLLTISGGELATTIEEFKNNPQTELHIRPDTKLDNRGYVIIPPGKQETLNFYFHQTSGYTYLKLYIVK